MASIATNLYNSATATMWVRKSVHFGLNRLFHQTSSSSSSVKGNLSKLRKKTGFSFINCKKALEKFENDIEKAEVWLKEQAQKEGWSKATKLKDRATAQGLIGLICQDQCATMVEVNCETDFVARNNKFQHFVGQAASSTLAECKKMNDSSEKAVKKILSADELKNIPVIQESKSLGELLVLTIGQIGENMSLRRGIFINAPSGSIIESYVHSALANPKSSPSGKFTLGKYAALVLFRRTGETQSGTPSSDIGRRLSQHVVGMNPKIIGEYKPPTAEELEARRERPTTEEDEEKKEKEGDGETIEDEMLKQEYLLDPSLTVGDLLLEENVEVIDFVRFECGESN